MRKSQHRKLQQTGLRFHAHALASAIHILSHHLFYSFIVVVLVSALLSLPLTLFYTVQDVTHLVDHLNTNAKVSIYVEAGTTDQQTQTLITELKLRKDTRFIDYIAPETGLTQFEQQTGLNDLTAYLQTNPIPGVIILQPTENQHSVRKMNALAQTIQRLPNISNVVVNAPWIHHIYTILHNLNKTLIVLSLIIFILIQTVTVTLFHLLLPSFEATPSNTTMLYLALLLGFVSGLVVDTLSTYFLEKLQLLIRQFNILSVNDTLANSHLLSTLICSMLMLALAALIVRKYQLTNE
jgi:hypothetical protein